MNYNIRGDKLLITKSIKGYVEDKISKINKYFVNSKDITAYVVCKKKGREMVVEVTIPTNNFTLRAEETHKDLYSAIDLVTDKIEGQIRKNKTKLKNKKDETFDFVCLFEEKDKDLKLKTKIVKRKEIETKPMDEEEAILQMNLIDHDFFIYKDSETGNCSVIYLRKDGNYGKIELI